MLIEIAQCDITCVAADAIVNAANPSLLGGGGVDGAIHRRAGPQLREVCRSIPELRPGVRCPTGEARATPAFDLPARYIIHTVGPVWHGGEHGESELLAACYRNSLDLAHALHLERIVFPAISCGAYAYPPEPAAHTALQSIRSSLAAQGQPGHVIVCCFSDELQRIFQDALEQTAD